jgi:hypothetical protein
MALRSHVALTPQRSPIEIRVLFLIVRTSRLRCDSRQSMLAKPVLGLAVDSRIALQRLRFARNDDKIYRMLTMSKWRVGVSYWCGFTKDRQWQDQARAAFEALGWSDIRFGNRHNEDYVPFSSNVDADEIHFVATADRLDREEVERILKQIGIEHTAYVTIEPCQAG